MFHYDGELMETWHLFTIMIKQQYKTYVGDLSMSIALHCNTKTQTERKSTHCSIRLYLELGFLGFKIKCGWVLLQRRMENKHNVKQQHQQFKETHFLKNKRIETRFV